MDPLCESVAAAEERCQLGYDQPDINNARLPASMLAVIDALRFRGRSLERLKALDDKQWTALFAWSERCGIALMLPHFCEDTLPPNIAREIAHRQIDVTIRMQRLNRQLAEISQALYANDLPFVVLKGFTHSPELTPDPTWRVQADIDLWCPAETAQRAQEILQSVGYKPGPHLSQVHLPSLLPPGAREWNGNFADAPISVELHFQLWSAASEKIPIRGLSDMWNRRETRAFDGQAYEVLARPDLLAFSCLHFFMHLMCGDLPLQRIWEIANFLHNNSDDARFWRTWKAWHCSELRQVQALVFRIAASWFRCATPPCLAEERDALPAGVRVWLDDFVFSPLRGQADSNKNYVWLHVALTLSFTSRCQVLARCFFPTGLLTIADRMDRRNGAGFLADLLRYRTYLVSRAKRHALAIMPTLAGGAVWTAKRAGFADGFVPFLVACTLFNLGGGLVVLLYNLYLLDRGFHEDFLGLVIAAMTAGTLVGTPLAALIERRVGLRGLLVTAALGGGFAAMLRVLSVNRTSLLLTAALHGAFFGFWAVGYVPAIAGLTPLRGRSIAFSLFTAMGMSCGILVGVIAGKLPEWTTHLCGSSTFTGKQSAILVGVGLIWLAAIPATRLRLPGRDTPSKHSYPRSAFVRRFMVALFLWIAATSSFNSFATAYLSLHLHFSLQKIGSVFSSGQALQVLAVLCGPVLIYRLGESRYLLCTALGTACMLLLLAVGPQHLALAAYLSYVTVQYMNEPGLFGLLMNRVKETERTGASSLMFLTISVASTVTAALAGKAITQFNYSICLSAAAVLAAAAALLFSSLPRRKNEI